MLEQLTFDIVIITPHALFTTLLYDLRLMDNKSIRNAGWAMLNDTIYTVMCLCTEPRNIAVAAIYFGAKHTGETIDDISGMPWWEYVGVSADAILKVMKMVRDFWLENPLRKENPLNSQNSPASSLDDELDITRGRAGSARRRSRSPVQTIEKNPSPASERDQANGKVGNELLTEFGKPVDGSEAVDSPDIRQFPLDTSGNSDALEKAVANDPATHVDTAGGSLIPHQPLPHQTRLSPKRKDRDEEHNDEISKRLKGSGPEHISDVL